MGTLHVVPTFSAGGAMHQALCDAGRNDEVLVLPDDLSCGPIDSDETSFRVNWWASYLDTSEINSALPAFWARLCEPHERLILWFGRLASTEFAFFLACAERLGDRPYAIVDVSGLRFPPRRAGDTSEAPPTACVSLLWPDQLASLLATEQEADQQLRLEMSNRWRQLKRENARFRIVTSRGLESAPVDVFDAALRAHATTRWTNLNLVVGMTLGHEAYLQVGVTMLLSRIVALVEAGSLEADGDPWEMQSCRVRLPA